jgi:hypothetical protein
MMLVLLATLARAEPAVPTADPLVERLLAVGLTDAAYTEAVRGALGEPDPAARRRRDLEAGAVLWRGGSWRAAAAHFRAMGDATDVTLAQAWSLARAGDLAPATLIVAARPEPEARLLEGWLRLRQRDVTGARATWERISADHLLAPRARALLDAATSLEGVVQVSPTAAGVLSAVVPGAGQALVGRWGEAASALVVNGALVASAVELGRRETWFGMGLVSFLGVGFYGGNIVSAAQGAKLENRRAWSRALLPIEGAHGVNVILEDGAVVVR